MSSTKKLDERNVQILQTMFDSFDLPRDCMENGLHESKIQETFITIEKSYISALLDELQVAPSTFFLAILMIFIEAHSTQEEVTIGIQECIDNSFNVITQEVLKSKNVYNFIKEVEKEYPKKKKSMSISFAEEKIVEQEGAFNVFYAYYNEAMLFEVSQTIQEQAELAVCVEENSNEYVVKFFYKKNTGIYLYQHFEKLLRNCNSYDGKSISSLNLFNTEEERKLLKEFNDFSVDYDAQKTILDLFEQQVKRNAKSSAIVFQGVIHTYQQVDERTDSLGSLLRKKGVQADDFVAIIADRSFELIEGIYGVLKAGGAYVPISPNYPNDRIMYILEDCSPKVVLFYGEAGRKDNLKERIKDVVDKLNSSPEIIDLAKENIWNGKCSKLDNITHPENAAYCIFTSGSTGKPKGVVIENRNVVNYVLENKWNVYGGAIDNQCKKILGVTAMTFDIFVTEIILSLIHGMELYLTSDLEQNDTELVAKLVKENHIDVLQTTPSRIKLYLASYHDDSFFNEFKVILMGGENVPYELCKRLRSCTKAKLYNVYGPSEATVWATMREIAETETRNIVGKPMANVKLYIERNGTLCGIGMPGELCIAGDGIARGYLNNEKLTSEKFVSNPYGDGRLYHTGDVARWTADGSIEFIGRMDEQVKVRGFRIELSEIENVIRKIEAVQDVVVIARADQNEDQALYCYLVSKQELDLSVIRETIQKELPDYMIPSYMLQIDGFPLSPNGKLDRKALPVISETTRKEYIAPENEEEAKVCEIFEDILQVERVSVQDNFFHIGGHSLKVARLINDIIKCFGIQLSYSEIFRNNTPREIVKLLKNNTGNVSVHLEKADEKEYYSLSQAQKRMYYVQMLDNEVTYNLPQYFKVKGKIDSHRLHSAFCKLISNYEILRTEFHVINNEPVQIIKAQIEEDYQFIESNESNEQKIMQSFIQPFDLEKPSQVRLRLVKCCNEFFIFVDIHHIISDGMSQDLFIKKLVEYYYAQQATEQDEYQYKDYSEWIIKKEFSKEKEYWNKVFEEDIPVLELPLDYARPKVQDFKGETLIFDIPERIKQKVLKMSEESNTTEYMILMSAFAITMSKYSMQEDIVLGSVISGRKQQDTQNMLGMFVNTLAIRSMPKKEKTFLSYLNEMKDICLNAYENQDYPFDELVDDLQISRDMSRNPVFDVMFALQTEDVLKVDSTEFNLEERKLLDKTAKFDMTVEVYQREQGYRIRYGYRTSLYKKETIEGIANRFISILDESLAHPQYVIQRLNGVVQSEIDFIFNNVNNTTVQYNKQLTIPAMFEEQVKSNGDRTAVVFGDEKLTYVQLGKKVNSLAYVLRREGIRRDDLVAIISDKSLEMIQGIFGIMKAGGAYVPIDPMYPDERIEYMILDCKPKAVLIYENSNKNGVLLERISDIIKKNGCQIEIINLGEPDIWTEREEVEIVNKPEDLAYCIYTSGTTGRPKGVLVENRGVASMRDYLRKLYQVTNEDRVLQFANYIFDASVWEITISLLNGAALYIISSDIISDVDRFNEYVEKRKITLTLLPPQYYLQTNISCLRVLTTGGSAANKAVIEKAVQSCKYVNAYGPTENTVLATHWEYNGEIPDNIPIGVPVNNSKIVIMNGSELCGIGMPGELCITGDGLARGYLNLPELTKEKFVSNPFGEGRMYRTGDLARILPNGFIEYMGRIDEQVKIRGFRIELGDVENAIRDIDVIEDVVVIALADLSGDKALYAYYVAETTIEPVEVKKQLERELPSYMIPSYMMQLDAIPVTRSGKVDRKKLPKIESTNRAVYVAPQKKVEKMLCRVMEEVMNVKQVGIQDGFFEMGGDSIKAIRIVSKIREAGYSCTVKDIMNSTTVAELVDKVGEPENITYEQGTVSGEILLTPIYRWFLAQNIKKLNHFNQSMVLTAKHFDEEALKVAFDFLVKQHDMLRCIYEEGKLRIRDLVDESLYYFNIVDMETGIDVPAFLYEEGTRLQESIELASGPVLRVCLFRNSEEEYLLIVIHHFVVDGVSWRILLEDLKDVYNEYRKNGTISSKMKTASFKLWAEAMKEYEESGKLNRQKKYWDEIDSFMVESGQNVPAKREYTVNTSVVKVAKEDTSHLLKDCNKRYHTQINDLLLAGLGMSVKKVLGYSQVAVGMEGHGRENLHKKIHIDRTVGWFTTYYPVKLQIKDDVRNTIIATKEMFRNVPDNGIGYGALRYGSNMSEEIVMPEISFNYLGVFEENENVADEIHISSYSGGNEMAYENQLAADIIVDGVVRKGELVFEIQCNADKYSEEKMNQFMEAYQESLSEIVKHCMQAEGKEYKTASDYGLHNISPEEFEVIVNTLGNEEQILDVFPLTSMQKGLLYHQLNGIEGEYFVQSIYSCPSWVSKELVEKALYLVAEKDEILKSTFIYEDGITPVQVILKDKKIECNEVDISKDDNKQVALESIRNKDMERGFNISKDSLLRVTLVKTGIKTYKIVFSFHHIIVDGWSVAIIQNDFEQTMQELHRGKTAEELEQQLKKEKNSFGDCVRCIYKKDVEEGIEYWKGLLEGYEGVSEIMPLESKGDRKASSEKVELTVKKEIYKKIFEHAKKNSFTVNNYIETAIGILLQKYNAVKDVVFGKVISGRNLEVDGIEKIPGIFINTIPLRVNYETDIKIIDLLSEVKKQANESAKYDYIGLTEIQNEVYSGHNLINILFAFENYYVPDIPITGEEQLLKEYEREQTNYDITFVAYAEEELSLEIMYQGAKYTKEEVQIMLRRLEYILAQMVENETVTVLDIETVLTEEVEKIHNQFNNTEFPYQENAVITNLIEYQAEVNGSRPALVYEGKTRTYQEFNKRVNCLARELRGRGIGRNDFVVIISERGLEMIEGIYGIIKSGGAYVPIDPTYPINRIQYMLKDCNPKVALLYRAEGKESSEADYGLIEQILQDRNIQVIWLSDESVWDHPDDNLDIINEPEDLAYCIYTSGTTGNPKGVLLEHRGVTSMAAYLEDLYQMTPEDKVLQFANYIFDASVWEMTIALYHGAALYLVTKSTIADVAMFNKYMNENGITITLLPPQYFIQTDLTTLRVLTTGGSAANSNIVEKAAKRSRYINAYGPTENTVLATHWEYKGEKLTSIPIGQPIYNTKLYILNGIKECGIGMIGELCITGLGVARGYLNRKEMTEEKFVPNPFGTGKMYRSGDLARWLPDGNIEYMGRIDEQIKIRGFRIELGDIENALRAIKKISDAVAIVKSYEGGDKEIWAYFVSEEICEISEIKGELMKQLPDYMIPKRMMQIQKIPVTRSGKVDKKELPEIEYVSNSVYEEPQTKEEEVLCNVLEQILDVSRVGRNDNFFELGGDSIKAIRISSKVREAGYQLSVKNIMTGKIVFQIAESMEASQVAENDQKSVSGEIQTTPIMNWLMEQNFANIAHFNMSFVLERKQFDCSIVQAVLNKITLHHDVLRGTYQNSCFYIRKETEGKFYDFEEHQLQDVLSEVECKKKICEIGNQMQTSINLSEGPLLKASVVKTKDKDYLLVVVHHFAADGVSLRILIEDIKNGYESYAMNGEMKLPMKTASFIQWTNALKEYAQSERLKEEYCYWKKVDEIGETVFSSEYYGSEYGQSTFYLDKEVSKSILEQCQKPYNNTVTELLLAGLVMAYYKITDRKKIVIGLEGHGREEIHKKIAIDRTVGWFTTNYPIVLKAQDTVEDYLIDAKETLASVPNKGFGYGVLRYLSTLPLQNKNAEILFNYLGNLNEGGQDGDIRMSSYAAGEDWDAMNNLNVALVVNCLQKEGRLKFEITFNKAFYQKLDLERKFEIAYQESCRDIISYCDSMSGKKIAVASDYQLYGFLYQDFRTVMDWVEKQYSGKQIKEIYRLTPLQQGMLFHQLNGVEGEYFIQADYEYEKQISKEIIEDALQILAQKYEVLKTVFVYEQIAEPLQIIFDERELEVQEITLSEDEDFLAGCERIKKEDQKRGFALEKDSLIRVTIVTSVNSDKNCMILSMHHIIIDGWSFACVFNELEKICRRLRQGETKQNLMDEVMQERKLNSTYGDYVRCLLGKNKEESIDYWRQYLDGYDNEAEIISTKEIKEENGVAVEAVRKIPLELTRQLEKVCAKNSYTMSTCLETTVGIILQNYNNFSDVVFGKVVSGRAEDITGIENMVGLFINTIPKRIESDAEITLQSLLAKVQKQSAESMRHDFIGLDEMNNLTDFGTKLVKIIFAYENYYVSNEEEMEVLFRRKNFREQTNYDITFSANKNPEGLEFDILYNSGKYEPDEIERLLDRVEGILVKIANEYDGKVSEMECITEKELHKILNDFNDTSCKYPSDKSLAELFEEQVEKVPDKKAVVFRDIFLTYRELNERSNQIARKLREYQLKPDDFVAIVTEKSIEMIIGILGIVKAGAAYVPIDPAYPVDRNRFILEDCQPKAIVKTRSDMPFETGLELIDIFDKQLEEYSTENLELAGNGKSLAYAIYTSGTTGKPKGSLIENRSIVRLVKNTNYVDLTEKTVIMQTGSMAFDASTFEVWGTLLNGGQLILGDQDILMSPELLKSYLRENKVNTLFMTTALYNQMIQSDVTVFDGLDYFFIGGEKHSEKHVNALRKHSPELHFYNVYGPTENTTFTSYYEIPLDFTRLPIGKPITNTQIYVMNGMKMCGIGMNGELCTAGEGVARGYLNRPDLTDKKFIDNPYGEGKIYRTGDLVRWLPDGNIEFIGRIDEQVKIRGFRIELLEIENALRNIEAIRNATVIVKVTEDGEKVLNAYFESAEEKDISQIKDILRESLPDYMIPVGMMQIDKIPVTRNGKVDKRALPEITVSAGNEYVAATNEAESLLCSIFTKILNIEKVGRNDSFFELGGDSIKAIRVVSRIREAGFESNVKDILKYKTVSKIAAHMYSSNQNEAEQGEVEGPVNLTPIMKWFWKQNISKPEYVNQSIMLKTDKFNREALHAVLDKIVEHHDMLRAIWVNQELVIRRIGDGKAYDFHEYNLQGTAEGSLFDKIEEMCNELQASINLEHGPLMKVAVFTCDTEEHLCIVIHHLVVDGVSWRILFDDIQNGYQEYLDNKEIHLADKTVSFKEWSELLQEYAKSDKLQAEKDYWMQLEGKMKNAEIFSGDEEKSVYRSECYTLCEEESDDLIHNCNTLYNTTFNDLLLAALGEAWYKVTNSKSIAIAIEGHGREEIHKSVMIDRTVGWFTSCYPIVVETVGDVKEDIIAVKEMFRNIPNNGIGYGILKYCCDDILQLDEPAISFNYMGDFQEKEEKNSKITYSDYSCGEDSAKENIMGSSLMISGVHKGKKIVFNFEYDASKYPQKLVKELAENYGKCLKEIIAHCTASDSISQKTASDYGLRGMDIEDFNDIMSMINDITSD